MLCVATVFVFVRKDLRFIELIGELRDRVLNGNTIYFVRIFKFFHGLPLIILNIMSNGHALILYYSE